MDEELLISLVEQYKELYDLQHPKYDDVQRRNNIWEEIGKIIKQPAQDCRDRWKRIRENYRRAKKLRKTKSGQSAKNIKDPKYTKILSFLNPYIDSDNDTDSNMPALDSPSNVYTDDDNFSQASGSSTKTEQGEKKKKTPYQIYKRPRAREDVTENTATHSLFQEYIQKKYSSQNKSDPIVAFFENLGQTVNSFPEAIQIRVKREVFKIVSEAEEEVYRMKAHNSTDPEAQRNNHHFTNTNNVRIVESPLTTSQDTSNFIIQTYTQMQPEENPLISQIETAPMTITLHPNTDIQNTVNEYLNFNK